MSVSTILIILLLVGYSLYAKRLKKAVTAASAAEEDPSLEDDQDGMFYEEYEEKKEEHEFFTYEAEKTQVPEQKSAPTVKPRPVVAAVEEEPLRPQFDLRQAVIAQVILNNGYIHEINQQNQ